LAGLQLALAATFDRAWQARGRAIVEATFRLHALLGQHAAQAYTADATGLPLPRPYAHLLQAMATQPSWRAAALRWIDLQNQRLTLHRYSDPQHRRLQTHSIFVTPLQLLEADLPPEALHELEEPAEQWLAAWDLLYASAHAAIGWNRIALPTSRQMGGFFGLGDEARPPDPAEIQAKAETLCEAIQNFNHRAATLSNIAPWLAAGVAALQGATAALVAALCQSPDLAPERTTEILRPFSGPLAPQPGWLGRIKDLLTSRG
jgi:hypothetical protein